MKLKLILLFTFLIFSTGFAQEERKPLGMKDILAWKTIRNAAISNNGQWFAYKLAPNEGDATLVIKEINGEKEYSFPCGESPGGKFVFSDNSKWLAFGINPKWKEAKLAKKTKKPLFNKMGLADLDSGEMEEFEKVKSFSFSNESSAWIALHRYPPVVKGGKAKGVDLLLHQMGKNKTYNIGNVSEFGFDKKGEYLAWIVDANGKWGNGVQLRRLASDEVVCLDQDKAVYEKLTWNKEGTGLAVLKGVEDEGYEDLRYCVVVFKGFFPVLTRHTYNPTKDMAFPKNFSISPNRRPRYTKDLSGILMGIHEMERKDKRKGKRRETKKAPEEDSKKTPKKAPEDGEDLPGLVIWHHKDPRLQSMQQVQQGKDEDFSYLCVYRVKENKFIQLADEEVKRLKPAPKQRWALGFDRREYELSGNLSGKRFNDVYVIDMHTGERKLALKKNKYAFDASPDGTHFLYFEGQHFHIYDMAAGKSYNITQDLPTSFVDDEKDENVKNFPIRPVGWSKDSSSILLYDNWDVWLVPVHGGEGINLTQDGKEKQIRYPSRFILDPEEKGIDLEQPLYFKVLEQRTKKGGIAKVLADKPGAERLLFEDAAFPKLMKAKNAEVFVYSRSTCMESQDYYVSDETLRNGKKITNANPQQAEFKWCSGARLIDYTSKAGDKLQAALFLPADYQEGKAYPTIVYVYEKLSNGMHRYSIPSCRGFNRAVYTSDGYAVLMPDITYQLNDPGISALNCVIPAVEAAAATGVVDINRVALHGHSWGGYETAFIITQTGLFKAAVAGAPLTNLVSMYSSIYWNTGSANQAAFESAQGRFTGGYWENMEAYIRNSPICFAENVTTPLMLLHNDKDGAVDWNQGIEFYNTLRRLNKTVVMLQYKGENHGLSKPMNQKDYFLRLRQFFAHYLKGQDKPKWLDQGVSHLEMNKHLKAFHKPERLKKKMEGRKK